MSDAHDEDVRKRKILLNLYTETQKTVTKLDSTIYSILEQNIGNVKRKVENNINQLQLKEYFVLVAGKCEGIQLIIYIVILLNLI